MVDFLESLIKHNTLHLLENKAYGINYNLLVYSTFCEDLSGVQIILEPTVYVP